jgi:hypothetical protein
MIFLRHPNCKIRLLTDVEKSVSKLFGTNKNLKVTWHLLEKKDFWRESLTLPRYMDTYHVTLRFLLVSNNFETLFFYIPIELDS